MNQPNPQLVRALELARELKRRRPWVPLPGPQTMAYESEADITGYGGAAGGGKTDLLAGLVLTKHKRSLIVRREKAQTEGVVQRLEEIVGVKDGFNSQKAIWKVPIGAQGIVEFAGLDNPGDERRWQGRPHDLKCVAAGTPVWMADGTRKPVEQVQAGDEVFTLEGPKRVTRTLSSIRPAVRVTADGFSQVQAYDHALLGPCGWLPCPTEPVSPNARCCERKDARSCGRTCRVPSRRGAAPPKGRTPFREHAPGHGGCRTSQAFGDDTAGRDRGSDYAASSETRRASAPQVLSRLFPRAHGWLVRGLSVCGLPPLCVGRGGGDALERTSPLGSKACCSCDLRRRGGRPRLCAAADLRGLHRPACAGPQNPIYLLGDGDPQTPKRSLRRWSYTHPYTKETRRTAHPVRAVSCRVEAVGCLSLYDLTIADANHYVTGAGFVNRNCFDEATEMREAQVRFIMGWTRSSDPKVRPRVVMTFNPPTTAEGRWVIKFFAPWLDKKHPNPAVPGELRWFTTMGDEDEEVPDGRSFVLVDGERVYDFDPKAYKPEDIITPKSRTFIPARLTDNKFYMATGYMSQLQALPEPLRSQMLRGDFDAGVEDDIWQVIPTAWVEAAQARWSRPNKLEPMDSMGVDVARGGKDNEVIARRHGMWFDEPVTTQGPDTNTGPKVAGRVVMHLRDKAPVHLDVIGVGASPYDFLNEMGVQVLGVNVAEAAGGTDKSGRLTFSNLRSELWWRMREALDPDNNTGIALPPDPRLLADLCAPKWSLKGYRVYVESREQIVERIRRSPDFASAYILALMETPKREIMFRPHKAKNRDYDPFA